MQKSPARPASSGFRPLLAALFAFILIALTACCGKSGPTASPSAPKPLEGPEETVKLYRNNCISCHGTELQGKMGPDSDLRHVGSSLSKEQIIQQIENGGSLMKPFKDRLKPEQIQALADWLYGHK